MSSEGGLPGGREVAYRVFADEFEDSDLEYSEDDIERAPNYVVTPTGARINRLFVVGVLTETEPVSEDVIRARIVDPTGAFVVYAGQYQPEVMTFLEEASIPSFVAVTGKARTFQPDNSDQIFTSIRPESINEVDAETRDRWTVQTAEQTLDRVIAFEASLERTERGPDLREALQADDVSAPLADGISRAITHYGTSPTYLSAVKQLALDAVRHVAGDREEVRPISVSPHDDGFQGEEASGEMIDTDETVGETESAPDAEDTRLHESAESGAEDPSDALSESPSGTAASTEEAAGVALNDSYELDEEERAKVEEEYGTEFSTATELETEPERETEPSTTELGPADSRASEQDYTESADIDSDDAPGTSDQGGGEEDPGERQSVQESDSRQLTDREGGKDRDDDLVEDEDRQIDLEDLVVETIKNLDSGDGAARESVKASVCETQDVGDETVQQAIQDALLSGRCYEPTEDVLKAI